MFRVHFFRTAAMNLRRFIAVLALSLVSGAGGALAAGPSERETNFWPFYVQQRDASGRVQSWTGAGPLLFRKPAADRDGNTATGFRPAWVEMLNPQGQFRAGYFLYPLFTYSVDENTYKWSVFELNRRTDRRASAGAPTSMFDQRGEFELWPFWFSRQ